MPVARTCLSPRWGFPVFCSFPWLAPWAAFLRRFAAQTRLDDGGSAERALRLALVRLSKTAHYQLENVI